MSTKHTPGPWIAVIDNLLSTIPVRSIKAAAGNHLPVAIVHAHQGSKGPAEGIANARLIAAAPDMLKALEAALPELENYEGDIEGYEASEGVNRLRATIGSVKAVIKAAKGGA